MRPGTARRGAPSPATPCRCTGWAAEGRSVLGTSFSPLPVLGVPLLGPLASGLESVGRLLLRGVGTHEVLGLALVVVTLDLTAADVVPVGHVVPSNSTDPHTSLDSTVCR